jgi:hypothetical protein
MGNGAIPSGCDKLDQGKAYTIYNFFSEVAINSFGTFNMVVFLASAED